MKPLISNNAWTVENRMRKHTPLLKRAAPTGMYVAAFLCAIVATSSNAQQARVPIVGLPCEGCEAVFDGQPAQLNARARIAPLAEPGSRRTTSTTSCSPMMRV